MHLARLLLAGPALLLALLLTAGCGLLDRGTPVVGRGSDPPAEQRALRVLADWDRERAAAYGAGSVTALRRLYVDGAGAADVRLLRSYLRRGLVVEELTVQVLAFEVRERGPRTLLLRVTDRVSRAVAVGPAGRVVLPADRASRRLVRLERDGGRWLVSEVRAA